MIYLVRNHTTIIFFMKNLNMSHRDENLHIERGI